MPVKLTPKGARFASKPAGKGNDGSFGTAYSAALTLNNWYNHIRVRLGLQYWSLSAYLKHQVKDAVKFISDFERNEPCCELRKAKSWRPEVLASTKSPCGLLVLWSACSHRLWLTGCGPPPPRSPRRQCAR